MLKRLCDRDKADITHDKKYFVVHEADDEGRVNKKTELCVECARATGIDEISAKYGISTE